MEKIKELLKMISENSELKTIFMVDNDSESDYTAAERFITSIEKDIYILDDGHYIIGEDDIKEHLSDMCCELPEHKALGAKAFLQIVDEKFEELENKKQIKEAVFVFME